MTCLITIDNPYFEQMLGQIYPTELQLNKANSSLWESVIVLCFVVRYFMYILVLQSSSWGRESWLLCLVCLPDVS